MKRPTANCPHGPARLSCPAPDCGPGIPQVRHSRSQARKRESHVRDMSPGQGPPAVDIAAYDGDYPGTEWSESGDKTLGFDEQTIGLVLAISSSIFIGSSFIVKKRGLRIAGSTGLRAGGPRTPSCTACSSHGSRNGLKVVTRMGERGRVAPRLGAGVSSSALLRFTAPPLHHEVLRLGFPLTRLAACCCIGALAVPSPSSLTLRPSQPSPSMSSRALS